MKRIICLYGGPGSGKSKHMHGLVYKLKDKGFRAEANHEYIKDWIWERREHKPGDQTYFFAKQARKERVYINNELDFIVTDSPLILTHFYGLKYDWLEQEYNTSEIMLKHHHEFCKAHGYKTEHYIIKRNSEFYDVKGREQSKEEAELFDSEIKSMLESKSIKYVEIQDKPDESLEVLLKCVLSGVP